MVLVFHVHLVGFVGGLSVLRALCRWFLLFIVWIAQAVPFCCVRRCVVDVYSVGCVDGLCVLSACVVSSCVLSGLCV